MGHSAQDGVRQNAALFAKGAARRIGIFFVFSDMRASTIWLLRCTHRNALGRSAGNLSLFFLGVDGVLTPAASPPRNMGPAFIVLVHLALLAVGGLSVSVSLRCIISAAVRV